MNWYTLRVISGKEDKIKENILFELDYQELSSEVEDIMVPSENIVEMKEGKKMVKRKVFFPGYILINMSKSKEAKYLIENTDGVINFVGANGEPQMLKEDEITRIIGEVEGREGREVVIAPYKVGDSVKVTVSVSIFGRPTPIELNFLQVELEK